MHSVGNDIVTLDTIDPARCTEKRFYSKFMVEAEEALYSTLPAPAPAFEVFVWALWAAKEAAFKCVQRHIADAVFSPTRFVVTHFVPAKPPQAIAASVPLIPAPPAQTFAVTVSFAQQQYSGYCFINNQYIHTVITTLPAFAQVYYGAQAIDDSAPARQSQMVRHALLQQLEALLPGAGFVVEKRADGCPILSANGTPAGIPLSLAHHGVYVAYAFILP